MEKHLSIALNQEQDDDHVTMALALNFQLSESGQAPEWLPLIPAGQFTGRDGRTWHNTDPQAVINATRSVGRDVPWDIEHATELKGPKGEPAPAQAWIRLEELEVRDGSVWGRIQWNDSGRQLVESKSYKYYSPAFYYNSRGDVLGLKSVGLTNTQNLTQLPALNHQSKKPPEGADTMSLPTAIRQALGLAEDANEATAVQAIGQLKSDHQLALNRAENPDLEKYVPKDVHDLALNRAKTAEQKLEEIQEAEFEAEVDAAIEAGKVKPAKKESFMALCRQEGGLKIFRETVEEMPSIKESGKGGQKPKGDQEQTKLDDTELAICRDLGHTEEEFLASKG